MPAEWTEFLGAITDQTEFIKLTADLAAVVDRQSNNMVILRADQPLAAINTFGNGQNVAVAEKGKPTILIQQNTDGNSVYRLVVS